MYKLFIICAVLCISGCITPSEKTESNVNKNKIRAFVATGLAKSSMMSLSTPEKDEDEKLCDGSGFITHGDGHRTKCPGCKACRKNDEFSTNIPCNCDPCTCTDCVCDPCKCSNCNKNYSFDDMKQPTYYMYYFGADWCLPCQTMKSTTFKDQNLIQFLKDKKIKLVMLKEEDESKKQYFSFYKVNSLPTTLLIKADNLENVIKRRNGYMNSESLIELVESLNNGR